MSISGEVSKKQMYLVIQFCGTYCMTQTFGFCHSPIKNQSCCRKYAVINLPHFLTGKPIFSQQLLPSTLILFEILTKMILSDHNRRKPISSHFKLPPPTPYSQKLYTLPFSVYLFGRTHKSLLPTLCIYLHPDRANI